MSKIVMCKVVASLVMVVVVSVAGADSRSPQAMIEALLILEGQAYLDARDALLAGETEPGRLAQQIREAWAETQAGGAASQPDWLVLAFADALAMHATHPQEAHRLLNLEGLDPEIYGRRRGAVPSALTELQQMRHVAPLMIELYLKGLGWYTWLDDATQTEREILQADLLTVIGRSGYEASVPFLAAVIEDRGNIPDDIFTAAIRALGSTDDPEALPVLLEVLDAAHQDGDMAVYALAVEALGGIHDVKTWPYLRAELQHADPQVQAAAIRGARAYGSRWHWDHDPAWGAAVRREIGLRLVNILAETDHPHIISAVLAAVGSLATTGLRDSLQNEAESTTDRPRWGGASSESGSRLAAPSNALGGAAERLNQALSLVNRSLSRRQSP